MENNLFARFKGLKKSWKAYIIFTAALVVLCAAFLIYVRATVVEYADSQPENVIEGILSDVKNNAHAGNAEKLEQYIKPLSRFEAADADAYRQNVISLMQSGELTYRQNSAEGDGMEKVYDLFADGKKFAEVTLHGTGSRNKLFFFSMADWSADKIDTCVLGGGTDLKVYIPEGFSVSINDTKIEQSEYGFDDEDIPVYEVNGLYGEPKIDFVKDNGTPISYIRTGSDITPAIYNYEFTFSPEISVYVGGEKLEGRADGNNVIYNVLSMRDPDVVIKDTVGNTFSYTSGAEIPISRYTVELPDNFVLSVGGKEIPKEAASRRVNPDISELSNYVKGVELHDLLTYQISTLGDGLNVCVTDNLGKAQNYRLSEFTFAITSQSGFTDIPQEISKDIDLMKFAEDWSLFMTNDRTFDQISKYFVKGTTYYKRAYEWVHSIDSTFTSNHIIRAIEEKELTDYVRYTDDCFSARVKLSKTMYLPRTGATVVDRIDYTVYCVYYDDTPNNGKDDARWVVAVMHDAQ